MRLWIGEKPDQAKAIADVFPNPIKRNGFFECAGGEEIITYCVGHMYELMPPEYYNPILDRWDLDTIDLMIPAVFEYRVKESQRKQLETITSLMKRATTIVHCADFDREGQRIVDQILETEQVDPCRAQRLIVRALDPQSVRTAIENLGPNTKQYWLMGEAARARACIDNMVGLPGTRTYTLLGREAGYGRTIAVGRVKTPTLNLVVKRDQQIESFIPIRYFRVMAVVENPTKGQMLMEWHPHEGTRGLDEANRILLADVAQAVAATVTGTDGIVTAAETSTSRTAPPLPHNITSITAEANKRLNLTAGEIKTILQHLYERHKLISYPRTEWRHLPENQHADAPIVLSNITQNAPDLAGFVKLADPSHLSGAWNAGKIGAHHGIVPTAHTMDMSVLSEQERAVYGLIARSYIAQFYPDSTASSTTVYATIGPHRFQATATELTSFGWRPIFTTEEKLRPRTESRIPFFHEGDPIHCSFAESSEHATSKPTRYTDGTLIVAMSNIDKHIEDDGTEEDLKKTLAANEGIGTSSTRNSIIEELVSFGLLARNEKRQLLSTLTGREHILIVNDTLKSPKYTARLEQRFQRIEEGVERADDLIKEQAAIVRSMMIEAKLHPPKPLLGKYKGAHAPRPALSGQDRVPLRRRKYKPSLKSDS